MNPLNAITALSTVLFVTSTAAQDPSRRSVTGVVVDTAGYSLPYVKPSEIAGAELYPHGVGAPPQYQELNGSCGIVLIWTR